MKTRGAEANQIDKLLGIRKSFKSKLVFHIIDRRTKDEIFDECAFEYKEREQSSSMKIMDINNVPDFDTISTVGKVHVTSHPKRIKLNNGREVRKLECLIWDSTYAIRLTAWDKSYSNSASKQTLVFALIMEKSICQ